MGKRGKLDWDQAMLESGHRQTESRNKKWAYLKILNERLDAFERENIEAFNESDLYDDDEDVAAKLYIHPLGSCGSIKKEERNHCDTVD